MENCHIYLDESHTRGIDLRLPQHYRAAVTLGANLKKDKLVQGKQFLNIRRNRQLNESISLHENAKLNHGQSLVQEET
jgi:hypothetical protein